jgi:hypothetical protein
MIFGSLINCSKPVLAQCTDKKLEIAYRIGLKTVMGFSISTPNLVAYAAVQE